MKAGDLKRKLENVGDDALVVVAAVDHEYRTIHRAQPATGVYSRKYRVMSEYHGDDLMEDDEIKIDVLVIK